MAFPAAPFTPFAYDTGLGDLTPPDDDNGQFAFWAPEMTQLYVDYEGYRAAPQDALLYTPTSPDESHSCRSDAARSPGKQSHHLSHVSLASASLSPQADALIYTPASTMLDADDDLDADYHSTSPTSNNAHSDDFVMVHVPRTSVGEAAGGLRWANPRPAHPTPGPNILAEQMSYMPPASSSSSSSQQSAMPNPGQHWPSFPPPSTGDMDEGTYTTFSAADDSIYRTDSFVSDASSMHLSSFDPAPYSHASLGSMPFRSLPQGAAAPHYPTALGLMQPAPFHPQSQINSMNYVDTSFSHPGHMLPGHQLAPEMLHGLVYPAAQHFQPAFQPPHQILPSNVSPLTQQQHQIPRQTTQQRPAAPARPRNKLPVTSGSDRRERNQHIRNKVPADTKPPAPKKASASSSRPLIKAEPGTTPPSSIGAAPKEGVRKGGRQKGNRLNDVSRHKSHAMRKVGACWRCALQRDPCDEGHPCGRCSMRSQKGQTYFFECDRTKLPDLVHDFLPPSMTSMHQKQSIEDTVKEEVLQWDLQNGLDIYLSSGYGPPLRWRVHEFKPKTNELLYQLQYLQDRITGESKCSQKYAPPFGLLKLDTSDDLHFDAYLDRLLEPEQLLDFGWSCYEEESIFDQEEFQAKLLDLMCKLYIATQDQTLKNVLRDVLKMIIVTFIMGHTLTIVEETLPTVLESVRHSDRPMHLAKHTSPRLANRQLKFFFSVIRGNMYEKILKWLQQTLHTAGKKDVTWLQTFCATLGFAMVLEELQRTLQIQAEASITKRESNADVAQATAYNACGRIDERFKLLVGLFQCKYRDRTWSHGSFGPATPDLKEDCAAEFLGRLRGLVETREDHLRTRADIPLHKDNQGLYTTRLTARFLLPFLNLPS